MLMMKKPKDLEFEPVHPKNVLLASVVHGISCLFLTKTYLLNTMTLISDHENRSLWLKQQNLEKPLLGGYP
jgi:hypothetical protein